MNGRLISAPAVAALAAEATDAHRLWTGPDGWVERFGADYLISASSGDGESRIVAALPGWLAGLGLRARRVFARRLVKQPGEDDRPRPLSGEGGRPEAIVTERGLRFGVDFSAGYSVGLFCDQRANRARLEALGPRRVLNCFAYTGAFSVAGARAGAATLSLDLSRRSLDRARANLALNGLRDGDHRFIADDVFSVLPRLARRGEKFDAILLDPPTFSRGARGRVFRAGRDLAALLDQALDLAAPGANILLSTNARELDRATLESIARDHPRTIGTHHEPPPDEYPPGAASTTLWIAAA